MASGEAPEDQHVSLLVHGLGMPLAAPAEEVGLFLRMATANVIMLCPGRDDKAVGLGVSGRAASMAAQFAAAGLRLVGLQETRVRTEAPAQIGDVFVLTGPAMPSGRLGVQLWRNTAMPNSRDGGR